MNTLKAQHSAAFGSQCRPPAKHLSDFARGKPMRSRSLNRKKSPEKVNSIGQLLAAENLPPPPLGRGIIAQLQATIDVGMRDSRHLTKGELPFGDEDVGEKENKRADVWARENPKTPEMGPSRGSSPFHSLNGSAGTFGRRPRRQHGKRILRAKSSLTFSISSQERRSHEPSPSRNSDAESGWGTPRSAFHTRYNSSSSSRDAGRLTTPSPTFTFGAPRTPSRSSSDHRDSQRNVGSMFFNFQETPPPLPPLDHPAFNFPSSRSPELQPQSERKERDKTTKPPRPSRSLPSVQQKKRSSSTPPPPKTTRGRNRLSLDFKSEAKVKESPRRPHSRAESKCSIASSRRSSAEFSAKRLSSVGITDEFAETWEVKVSEELIRMSLSQEGHASSSARGRNEVNRTRNKGGEAPVLGSPITLQDSVTYSQAQPRYLPAADPVKPSQSLRIFPSLDSGPAPTVTMSYREVSRTQNGNGHGQSGKLPSAATSRRASKSNPTAPSPVKIDTASVNQKTHLLAPPSLSFTAATPEPSPILPQPKRTHHKSSPTPLASIPQKSTPHTPAPIIQRAYSAAHGKRKAEERSEDDVNLTPSKEHRATFAPEPRTHRASASSSHAPTSFHRTKRARISMSTDFQRPNSRSGYQPVSMVQDSPNAKSTGSWSNSSHISRNSAMPAFPGQASRPPSARDGPASPIFQSPRYSASRRSISNASIPISAYVSPQAPSITPSGTFHMRDPRKPARIQHTPWSLSLPAEVEVGQGRWAANGWVERGGSPMHSWFFFFGFIVFPLWWVAGWIVPIPRTRELQAGNAEKGVILDDPQVEHDYKSWRRRCRIMSGVSIVTYIPFIILVAVLA